jgi:pimeloyl-ACP methyl ester carboxylesterase
VVLSLAAAAPAAEAPREVSFPSSDGGQIQAHLYGSGKHGVVLAHGAVFNKESWQPLAERLAAAGLQVLAIDFRAYGRSLAGSDAGGRWRDIVAGVEYLEAHGAERVSAVGASMGGGAVARAATKIDAGALHHLVLLAPAGISEPERMRADSFLVVASRGEPGLSRVRQHYERIPDPKRLVLLAGDAHAQHVLATEQAEELMQLIVEELTASR